MFLFVMTNFIIIVIFIQEIHFMYASMLFVSYDSCEPYDTFGSVISI